VDSAEVMKAAVELVQPLLAERCISLSTAEMEGVMVLADRQRLTQVFLNLLSNAVKYNRDNGQVALGYRHVDGDVRIYVTDTGFGLSEDLVQKLFQPFERLGAERTNVPGTGLGLALSKRLVELMRGSVGVESKPGIGSTFWVQFHRLEQPAAEIARAKSPASDTSRKSSSTVLYIEDNLINIHLIEGIMKRRTDVRLISAMQGNLGLEMARIHTPDLILLDLHLPDLSGIQVLRRLREDPRTASIPVVVITADALPGTRRQLLEAGAYAYLNKPIDIKQFLSTIHPLLERDIIQ
jgi:CheY-like chemotaxis protein